MKNLNFPIDIKFHISSFSNDFSATDAQGKTIAYTRQKMFRLKEHVEIFDNRNRNNLLYNIKAGSWLDFSTSYKITSKTHGNLGRVSRKGFRSLWKATYLVIDAQEQDSYEISEENPLIKFLDGLLGEIPVVGFLISYLLNPTYTAKDKNGIIVLRLKKNPSVFGRRFTLNKIADFDNKDEQLLMLSFMMMLLLERARG